MSLIKILEKTNKEKKIHEALIKKHHAFKKETKEHPCHQFSLMLASALSSQSSVTDVQSSLFQSILDAFELGDIRGRLFEASHEISPNVLIDAVSVIKEAGLEKLLLLDCIILLLSTEKLSTEAEKLIGELAEVMNVDAMALSKITNEANEILGAGDIERQDIIKNIKPGTSSRKLTSKALSEGISGGLWYLDKDLEVTFPWQASDAIFVFKQGVSLLTNNYRDNRISGDMKITACKFVNASLIFSMSRRGPVSIDQCEWQGEYLRKDLSTAITLTSGELSVRNSKFTTPKACAIQGSPFLRKYEDGDCYQEMCKILVENCEFIDCGHIDLKAGAVTFNDFLGEGGDCKGKISNSRFLRCKGSMAGAIYAPKLNDLALNNCEFTSCESTGNKTEDITDLNFIAVYICEAGVENTVSRYGYKTVSSNISNCTFSNTSLQINDSQKGKAWLIKDSNFQNAFVFLPRSATWSSEEGIDNCNFKDGRVIKLD